MVALMAGLVGHGIAFADYCAIHVPRFGVDPLDLQVCHARVVVNRRVKKGTVHHRRRVNLQAWSSLSGLLDSTVSLSDCY